MRFASATTSRRRAKPSHQPWPAHPYQRRAAEFLCERGGAALFLDPGLGKTSIVLDAFRRLLEAGVAKRMLVIAPLRVCQTVWRQEGRKWSEFRDLRFSLLHGAKKADRLKDDADVWLINPEGCAWLATQYFGRPLPFDTVVIDELTKFKNARADRSKKLRPRLKGAARRWGLTGTPAPNGYMDLFGQMLVLDDGVALGKYITHYRDLYFQVDYNGFDYILQPGAEKRIEDRIRPYVLRMGAKDYLDLPPLVDDVRELDMETKARGLYGKMKNDMLAELPEGVVTGANAAAVYSKLKQMANGAVYLGDTGNTVSHIHNTKLDALEELVEELAGQPLLVAYEFNHDLTRLRERFPDAVHIGKGSGEKQTAQTVEAWNRGEVPLLLAHPASAGHGLNLQGSGAAHLCWFSPIWDLELYEQFIQRVHRQGTTAQRVVNHILVVRDTIDELALAALRDKSTTQARLLDSLNDEILRDAGARRAGVTAQKESKMVTKLARQADAAAEEPRRVVPKGWGPRPVAEEPAEAEQPSPAAEETAQRGRISRRLQGQEAEEAEEVPAAVRARAAFSKGTQTIRERLEGVEESPPVDPVTMQPTFKPESFDPDTDKKDHLSSDARLLLVQLAVTNAAALGTQPTILFKQMLEMLAA